MDILIFIKFFKPVQHVDIKVLCKMPCHSLPLCLLETSKSVKVPVFGEHPDPPSSSKSLPVYNIDLINYYINITRLSGCYAPYILGCPSGSSFVNLLIHIEISYE